MTASRKTVRILGIDPGTIACGYGVVEVSGPVAFNRPRYIECGVDMLFLEGPRTRAELADIVARFGKRIPLMLAMTAGGDGEPLPPGELERIGYPLVVFGGGNGLPRAATAPARRYLNALATQGTTQSMQDAMLNFAELQALLETEKMFALGDRYSGR